MNKLTRSDLYEIHLALTEIKERLLKDIETYSEELLHCLPERCDFYISAISNCQMRLESICETLEKVDSFDS